MRALVMSAAVASLCGLAAAIVLAESAQAVPDPTGQCLTADPPVVSAPAERLRFGVTPQPAGTVGASQGAVVPTSAAQRDAALARLRPPRRTLVIRMTRLFMSSGQRGIARVVARGRRFARAGFAVEAQV